MAQIYTLNGQQVYNTTDAAGNTQVVNAKTGQPISTTGAAPGVVANTTNTTVGAVNTNPTAMAVSPMQQTTAPAAPVVQPTPPTTNPQATTAPATAASSAPSFNAAPDASNPQTTAGAAATTQPALPGSAGSPIQSPAPGAATVAQTGGSVVDLLNSLGQDSSYTGRAALAQQMGIANYTGTASQNAQLASKYQTYFNSVQNSQAPSSNPSSEIAQATAPAVSSDPVFNSMASMMSPIMQSLTQVLQDINNPAITGVNLQQEYNTLSQQNNLPALQTQMLNLNNIMTGTEQDIRDEVTKAGGFATESQVQAMKTSRNNVILKQYNALSTQYQAAQTNVDNMMKYATSDQQTALARQQATAGVIENMASIQAQMMTMGMTMQQHATDNANKIVSNVGYQGLASQAGGSPTMLSYYEKTLGLAPGSLSNPVALKQLETYRQQQLAQGQQKINITLGNSGLPYTVPTDPSNPAPNSGGSLLQATGLSIQAFNYLTQGVSSMSRLSVAQRNQIMKESSNWLNKNGIDISTFQTRYTAYNQVLNGNIQRTNAAQIQENELQGTISNLSQTISQSDLTSLKPANIAKLFAGQQTNDPTTTKYSTYLLSLRNELAGYNAAVRGNLSAAGGPSPDKTDLDDAAQVIQNGIGTGSLRGFQQAITSQQEKMSVVLQGSVDSANKQVWSLFGVGNAYKSPTQQSAKSGMTNSQFVESTLTKQGLTYSNVISQIPLGKKGVINNSTGEIGVIEQNEFDPNIYTPI